jgi:GTP cyclohydrolase I
MDKEKIKEAIRLLLEGLGEEPCREGLRDTPRRVADMYEELLSGASQSELPIEKFVHYNENYDEMIILRNISFHSICEHHLLPFYGKVHVAYVPRQNKIIGLSKIGRLVETFSRRLQIQERLTTEIAEAIIKGINPRGVLVIIEAEHMCLRIRGIKKPGAIISTSAIRGIFREETARLEALFLIRGGEQRSLV